MPDYLGPLLQTLDSPDDFPDDPEPLPCEQGGGAGWGHSAAVHMTIGAICLGHRIRLTRRKMCAGYDEIPGEVCGVVIGASHQHGGRILLGVQHDDGDVVGVDVSDPNEWYWEVFSGH